MKRYLLLFVFGVFFLRSSIQAQYDYSVTDGLFGDALKSTLHNMIKGHTRYPYSSSSTDVWNILTVADRDPNNPDNVILIYTGYSVNGPAEYDGGNGWNREHVWAKSHGFPNSSDTAYTDCHHLKACDISTNSARGTKDFDDGGQQYFDNGTVPTECHYTSTSWEPRPAIKGDVARMMFYMVTRYSAPSSLELILVDYTGTQTYTPYFGKLSTLLKWNREDPPDNFERRRNNVVYSFQHNRNPYIDHPEFADRFYNADSFIVVKAETVAPYKFVVEFNDEVDPSTGDVAANYDLFNSDVNITAASVGYNGDNKKVELTCSANFPDSMYIVQVNNVKSVNGGTVIANSLAAFANNPLVGVNDATPTVDNFRLEQNFPNPFSKSSGGNPSTLIKYEIPSEGFVTLKVYDILGNEIATLVNGYENSGQHQIRFNADNTLRNISSGIYFYTLTASSGGKQFSATKKMMLLK